jgi:DNA-binding GntR family transcriptional regulator
MRLDPLKIVDTFVSDGILPPMEILLPQLASLRATSLASVLTQELERMVLGGEIGPGTRLNENQLAARFGVSRGPIREAVRALEGAGLVESVPNRGVFVRRLGVREVRELYDVRAALFGLAGRLMAERATPAELERLRGLIRAMETATETRNFEAYYPLNLEFHGAIVDGSGNLTLAQQYRAFVRKLNLFRARSLVQGGGLGLYGDFLFGENNRFGGGFVSSLAGPTAGSVDEVARFLAGRVRGEGNAAAEAIRMGVGHTPFVNLFYTRLALDHMVLFRLQEWANPGYLRRVEQRTKRENDQTFWLRPTEAIR